MPRMNGGTLYEEISQIDPSVSVLFLSGYSYEHLHKIGIFAEPRNFLSKPVLPANLLSKVREVLDNPQRKSAQAARSTFSSISTNSE